MTEGMEALFVTDAVEMRAKPKAHRRTTQLIRMFSKNVKPMYDRSKKLTIVVAPKTEKNTCFPTVLRF